MMMKMMMMIMIKNMMKMMMMILMTMIKVWMHKPMHVESQQLTAKVSSLFNYFDFWCS